MNATTRKILIHCHIFKNAGTTFNWRMGPQTKGVLRNAQVRSTGLTQETNIIKEQDYAAAIERIKNYFLFGLVERYDESMVLIEDQMRPHFPEIDLAQIAQNTSTRRQKSISETIDEIESSLGDKRFENLLENNQWDIKLYETADKLLSQQTANTSGFPEKLAHYKTRCQAL